MPTGFAGGSWPSATERIDPMLTASRQVQIERATFDQVYSDGFIRSLVRKKSKAMVQSYHFMRSDRDDIEQELWLRLFKSLGRFDSQAGKLRTFIVAVVERASAEIVRSRCAWKRGEGFASLDAIVGSGGTPQELAIADESMREVEFQDCLAAALDSLPDHLRDLPDQLIRSSIVDIAKSAGVERTTIHRRIWELKNHFEKVGLHEFL